MAKKWGNNQNRIVLIAIVGFLIFVQPVFASDTQEIIKLNLLDQNTLDITVNGYDEINWQELNSPELISEIKAGYAYLFNATVIDFQVGSNDTFLWKVTLNGDFSNGIRINEMPYHYSLYLPTSADSIELNGKLAIANYNSKNEYFIETSSKVGSFSIAAQSIDIAPLASSKLPIKNAANSYGKNSQSRFLIPGYTLVTGSEAQQTAEMYKPHFYTTLNDRVYSEVRYRVIRGNDPYSGIN